MLNAQQDEIHSILSSFEDYIILFLGGRTEQRIYRCTEKLLFIFALVGNSLRVSHRDIPIECDRRSEFFELLSLLNHVTQPRGIREDLLTVVTFHRRHPFTSHTSRVSAKGQKVIK